MRRRGFIVGMSSAATTGFPAYAQHARKPILGYLAGASEAERPHLRDAFRKGLAERGLFEGRDLEIVVRTAQGNADEMAQMARELIERKPIAIVTTGTLAPALVARNLTRSTPILFVAGADPVELGLVDSLSRPGANVTGVTFLSGQLTSKRIQLLMDLAPTVRRVAIVLDARNPSSPAQLRDAESAAQALNLDLSSFSVNNDEEIARAFRSLSLWNASAILFGGGPFLTNRRTMILPMVRASRLPASFAVREFVEAGGLMSYGPSLTAAYHLLGDYVARVFKGEKPADLPVQQSTRFELVLNLGTAKVMGLEIPDKVLALADEVIE